MYELMVLCRENGWEVASHDGDDRYVVTMETSVKTERRDQGGGNEHQGEGGVRGGLALYGSGSSCADGCHHLNNHSKMQRIYIIPRSKCIG